ncbi:hypothetical protein [Neoaquamicrobium sediminum]|uniref:hypothetical protein n=1 Tax=Neoaquamicrobium sediminum TaxID=1849104 RepID=UPI003BA965EB
MLLPLVVMMVFLQLGFERCRQPWVRNARGGALGARGGTPMSAPTPFLSRAFDACANDAARIIDHEGDDDGGKAGASCLDHRPPAARPGQDAAIIVAFLLRNRGRIDNDVVRHKWDLLDRFSLPLAVYLRDVEASGAWQALENELATAQLRPTPKSRRGKVRSLHHQRLMGLFPEWTGRGEDLMLRAMGGDMADAVHVEPSGPEHAEAAGPTM